MKKLLSADDFTTKVVNEYSDTIYKIALNITHSPQDAFDVCQEVFVRLIKHKHKIKDESHLKAWLIRVAVNCSKSCITSAYRRKTVSLDEVKDTAFYTEENDFYLTEKVMSLPEKYSTAIHLFYYEDMSVAEIAKALKTSEGAVKTRLSRGRDMLRKILEKENYYEL